MPLADAHTWSANLTQTLPDVRFFALSWTSLARELTRERERAREGDDDGRYTVCDDALAALRHFGYGARWFDTLPTGRVAYDRRFTRWRTHA